MYDYVRSAILCPFSPGFTHEIYLRIIIGNPGPCVNFYDDPGLNLTRKSCNSNVVTTVCYVALHYVIRTCR